MLATLSLSGCAEFIKNNTNINGAISVVHNADANAAVNLVAELTDSTDELTYSIGKEVIDCRREFDEDTDGKTNQYDTDGKTNPFISGNQDIGGKKTVMGRGRSCLALAYKKFHEKVINQDERKLRRNQLQERLIGASELACAQFKQHLNSYQMYTNFGLGSLSTLLAGAGAIATAPNAARTLSGSAAIVSGIRAEYNADFFTKLAAFVIDKAIDNWRADKKKELRDAQAKRYEEYTIQAAVADAMVYNDGCSLIVGLQRASDAVTMEMDPGLNRLNKLLNDNGKIQATPNGLTLHVNGLGALQSEMTKQIQGTFSPDYELNAALLLVEQTKTELEDQIGELEKGSKPKLEKDTGDVYRTRIAAETEKINKNLQDVKVKTESLALAQKYYEAVKQLHEVWEDETKFRYARAEFYAQQARVVDFKYKIALQYEYFVKVLKPIRDAIDKLKSTPAIASKTDAPSKPASPSQSDTNQVGDKVQTSKPAQNGAAALP